MVNLTKGANVDLSKEAGGALTVVRVGLGWDARKGAGDAFDLDASIVGLGADGKSAGPEWFVFYNALRAPGDAIVHQGDELTGDTAGDDEQIVIDFTKIPDNVAELAVAVTIHKAAERGQNFGLVDNAYVRIVDETTGTELARYDLSEDGAGMDVIVFGKAYRKDGSWKFKALGDTKFANGLQGLTAEYEIKLG